MNNKNGPILFSVVIPTRERVETLAITLRTAVEQEYANLEILVSDNASGDGTLDLIEEFSKRDSRVRYINPGRRLGMSEHWEFALSQVQGSYVMFMGDDDGLLPHAVKDIVQIIDEMDRPELITWAQATYMWPEVPKRFYPGLLRLPLAQENTFANANIVIPKPPYALDKLIMREYPSIYNKSAVSISLINQIKARSGGKFFNSRIPDIYSGTILGSAIDRIPVIGKSFSVNAQSNRSNGIAFTQPPNSAGQSEAIAFNAESQIQLHLGIGGKMTGILSLLWWECSLQAGDIVGGQDNIPEVEPESIIRSAFFAAHSISDDNLFQSEMAIINGLAEKYGLNANVLKWKRLARRQKNEGPSLRPGYESSINCLSIDTIPYEVKNVYQAAKMAHMVSMLHEGVFTPGWRVKLGLAHKYNYISSRLSISNIARYFLTRF